MFLGGSTIATFPLPFYAELHTATRPTGIVALQNCTYGEIVTVESEMEEAKSAQRKEFYNGESRTSQEQGADFLRPYKIALQRTFVPQKSIEITLLKLECVMGDSRVERK